MGSNEVRPVNIECPHCKGSGMIESDLTRTKGKKVFEGFMAALFVTCYKNASDREIQYFVDRADASKGKITIWAERIVTSKDLRKTWTRTGYQRMADLTLWGLLYQDPAWWHQGIYQLTELAENFLRGVAVIPKEIIVSQKNVLEQSDSKISLIDALRGPRYEGCCEWIRDWREKTIDGQRSLF